MARSLLILTLSVAVVLVAACGKVGGQLRAEDGTPVPAVKTYPPQ